MRLQGVTGRVQVVTVGYRGLHEVTRGHWRLQGVTRELEGVTRFYRGLHSVTEG